MSFQIAKAGWFQRQSTILRRWKRSWVVLYQDGVIKYFESPNDHEAEDAKLMRDAMQVKTALQVSDVTSMPQGCTVGCLIEIVFTDGSWILCAENGDDASAWVMAIEESRAASRVVLPPYQQPGTVVYPGQVSYGPHPPPYVVQGPNGQTSTIVYADNPGYYRRGYDGTDVALGAVGGYALGSLMWGPLLWW